MKSHKALIHGQWNIGFVPDSLQSVFEAREIREIRWMKHAYRDRFFADPFLYRQDDEFYYVLAEEKVFWEDFGKISLLKVDRQSFELVHKEVIISENHHLSYPFLDGARIIPESSSAGAVYAYEIGDGRLRRSLVLDEGLNDATLLRHDGGTWLFGTLPESPYAELAIFHSGVEGGAFKGHASNPVKNDRHSARPAGSFFTFEGDLYRPTQDCFEVYGHSIRLMKVLELTEDTFNEVEVMQLTASRFRPFHHRLHTFNVNQNVILVDGYSKRFSPIYKTLLWKFPSLFAWMNRRRLQSGWPIENCCVGAGTDG